MSFRDERPYILTEAYYRAVPDDFKPESLQQQTERFLRSGGRIKQIPSGEQSGPASISLRTLSAMSAEKVWGKND
jgi:hypothetical protein